MSENCKDTTERKNKWLKKGLQVIAVLTAIYISLFAVRFCQLNFYGKHNLYTTQIPETLHNGFLDSCWEGHYEQKDWERMQFIVQFVDLDGDFKTDFILYARDKIMVVKPEENGQWKGTVFADCVGEFIYLPFTSWGIPKVFGVKTEECDGGFIKFE